MKRAIAATLIFFMLPSLSDAAFTDFEDLTLGSEYRLGDTIDSKGLMFDIVNFNGIGSLLRVNLSGNAPGDGLEVSIATDLGLDFLLPEGAVQISLLYGAFEPDSGLIINNIALPLSMGFSHLDGSTIAGISITVEANDLPRTDQGKLIVSGPIDSFIIGGSELGIDDVSIIIPEPATVSLLICTVAISLIAVLRSQRP